VYCTLHCAFTMCFLSLSLVRMKVRDSGVLAWVRGQRKMSQVLGVFGLLDFTCYGPFALGARFETYETFISLIFLIFFLGRGKPRILNQWIRGHNCTASNFRTVFSLKSLDIPNKLYFSLLLA
jgi:hypothetical protein